MDPLLHLEDTVLRGPGHLPPEVRQAAAALGELPAPLAAYVDLVAHRAYATQDADLEPLRAAGRTEDEIFDLTVSAAVGAGMRRFRAGMAALAAAEATP